MALQYAQQEELKEAMSRRPIHTGYELTEELCNSNMARQSAGKTARERERIRKSIAEENRTRYKNFRISIDILIAIEEERESTRSAPSGNRTTALHYGQDLGGVSRAADSPTSRHTGGNSAAPLRSVSLMKGHSDTESNYELSPHRSSSGLRLCLKRTLVISIAIFVIVMILVFLRISGTVDIFGPILPTFT